MRVLWFVLVIASFVLISFCLGEDEGPFGAFWHGQAHFQYVSRASFGNPMDQGTYFVPVTDTFWYLFHREYGFEPIPEYCKADYARIVVRSTSDAGRTWSGAAVVMGPAEGTPYECALTDGAPYWDADEKTWHYLSQCRARDGDWNLCHFATTNANPMSGGWAPIGDQPVVKCGALWEDICFGIGTHCSTLHTHDEGTPEILYKKDGFFYVTFHGWDSHDDRSYRGAAKTKDFQSWDVHDFLHHELPGDAMFASEDCNNWNISWVGGRCVGGGAASTLVSGDYLYMMIEAPDVSLECSEAKDWVFGLVRNTRLGPTPTWEQFSVNPVVIPRTERGCALQYQRLFQTPGGTVYLSLWVGGGDMYLFQMVPGGAALPIVIDN